MTTQPSNQLSPLLIQYAVSEIKSSIEEAVLSAIKLHTERLGRPPNILTLYEGDAKKAEYGGRMITLPELAKLFLCFLLGHKWIYYNYTASKQCKRCGETRDIDSL